MLTDLEFREDQYPWDDNIKLLDFNTANGSLITRIDYGQKVGIVDSLVACRLGQGCYETGLNFQYEIEFYTDYVVDFLDPLNRHGVSDNIEQIVHRHPYILKSEEPFVISVTHIRKSEEPGSTKTHYGVHP